MRYSTKELRLIYDTLNEVCFDGELDRCPITIGSAEGNQGIYWWRSAIELNPKFCKWPCDWIDTLYHEMCHQFQREILLDDDRRSHGEVFWNIYDTGISKFYAKTA